MKLAPCLKYPQPNLMDKVNKNVLKPVIFLDDSYVILIICVIYKHTYVSPPVLGKTPKNSGTNT